MQPLGLNEIREKFLVFFEDKGHLRIPSFSLVPQNDKSLLIINSGMAPLKPFFTGQETPPSRRVATCQKCVRVIDIENVGKTVRHGTFFEMLGNFSFGDYFKEEIIPWSWEFLTEVLEISADRLYPSVYVEDQEAYDIWRHKVNLPPEKIFKLGKEDNFWEVGVGPCGPSSEIYFDRGEQYGCGSPSCTVGCDCDRYMEIWNLVFTQFNKTEDGQYEKLAFTNIDTGMGLERMSVAMQGVSSIFDVDTLQAVRDAVCRRAGISYLVDPKKDASVRIITDHVRSVTFMTADGILPSNEGRGYVLRRLLRRAARHGKLLGIQDVFLSELSKIVIETGKHAYPELEEKKDYIYKVLSVEENRFYETLDQGMELLRGAIAKMKKNASHTLEGAEAFRLYDTFGFPLDLMKEILEEEHLDVDEDSFQAEMKKQRERARAAREETNYMGAGETVYHQLEAGEPTVFEGYLQHELDGAGIVAITKGDQVVEKAEAGDSVSIVLDRTPFYAESGGQKGDRGLIKTETGEAVVTDCVKVVGGRYAHIGRVEKGTMECGQTAVARLDMENRIATTRNHTATHLLQKALRDVVGKHVEQAGSMVSGDRLRFDFTHFAPVSREELLKIEDVVNEQILVGLPVDVSESTMDEARKKGAMALFGEKYGSTVRVVDIGGYSVELCGGTHLKNTMEAGSFKIVSEVGIAAGVRRIEALTGKAALAYYRSMDDRQYHVTELIKATPEAMLTRIQSFLDDARITRHELEQVKSKMALYAVDEILQKQETHNGFAVLVSRADGLDMNGLRVMMDRVREKIVSGVALLGSVQGEKVSFMAMATEDAVKSGIHAGQIIKAAAAVTGGGGGGKPGSAQAGGKDASKIDEALEKGKAAVINCLTNP